MTTIVAASMAERGVVTNPDISSCIIHREPTIADHFDSEMTSVTQPARISRLAILSVTQLYSVSYERLQKCTVRSVILEYL